MVWILKYRCSISRIERHCKGKSQVINCCGHWSHVRVRPYSTHAKKTHFQPSSPFAQRTYANLLLLTLPSPLFAYVLYGLNFVLLQWQSVQYRRGNYFILLDAVRSNSDFGWFFKNNFLAKYLNKNLSSKPHVIIAVRHTVQLQSSL